MTWFNSSFCSPLPHLAFEQIVKTSGITVGPPHCNFSEKDYGILYRKLIFDHSLFSEEEIIAFEKGKRVLMWKKKDF